MKKIFKKLKSKAGETLVEILVGILVITLASALFAAMYSASMSINVSARKQDQEFYDALDKLEGLIGKEGSGEDGHMSGKVIYKPEISEGETDPTETGKDVDVDYFTENGITVYGGGGE